MAFGLRLYVTLASVCLPIAILLLIITIFLGSPALLLVFDTDRFIPMVVRILDRRESSGMIYDASRANFQPSLTVYFILIVILD